MIKAFVVGFCTAWAVRILAPELDDWERLVPAMLLMVAIYVASWSGPKR